MGSSRNQGRVIEREVTSTTLPCGQATVRDERKRQIFASHSRDCLGSVVSRLAEDHASAPARSTSFPFWMLGDGVNGDVIGWSRIRGRCQPFPPTLIDAQSAENIGEICLEMIAQGEEG
jgi:hypothetical protein